MRLHMLSEKVEVEVERKHFFFFPLTSRNFSLQSPSAALLPAAFLLRRRLSRGSSFVV